MSLACMHALMCQYNVQEPEASLEGLGGTYFFMNEAGKRSAIVKPCDEEPLAPCNPKVWPMHHVFLSWFCRLAPVRLIRTCDWEVRCTEPMERLVELLKLVMLI